MRKVFSFSIGGKTIGVNFEELPEEGSYRFEVEGKNRTVFVYTITKNEYLLIVDGKPWPARIVADDQDRLVIDLKNIQIGVVKSSTQSIQPTRSGAANSDTLRDPNAITSEIRGKVVKVLVSAHQNVEQDQPIVIVESMKMQATIRCDRAGTVKDVLVTAGNGVKPGDVLVTFD